MAFVSVLGHSSGSRSLLAGSSEKKHSGPGQGERREGREGSALRSGPPREIWGTGRWLLLSLRPAPLPSASFGPPDSLYLPAHSLLWRKGRRVAQVDESEKAGGGRLGAAGPVRGSRQGLMIGGLQSPPQAQLTSGLRLAERGQRAGVVIGKLEQCP